MASASLFKPSPATVFDKSEWAKGQSLRQSSVSAVRFNSAAPSALTVRAGAYSDELVKTAVSSFLRFHCFLCFMHCFRTILLIYRSEKVTTYNDP